MRWTLLLPALSTSACLSTPGRASLQDAGDPGFGDADLAADASEAGPPDQDAAWDDGGAVHDDAPRMDVALFDVSPDEQADPDALEPVDVAEAVFDATELPSDIATDPPPDSPPEAVSDPGPEAETVAPTLVRCVGRAGSGGLVGGNGVSLRGFVGVRVRALRVGE